MLTAQRLREVLDYDPLTGIFIWKVTNSNVAKSGSVAGTIGGRGRRYIKINRRSYLAHRLAWLYDTGEWPCRMLDHVNGDPLDNRIANLREATCAQNQWNVGRRVDNKTGFKGVSCHPDTNRWSASISLHGTQHYLGTFDSPESAHAAYCRAAKEMHGEFARTA